MSVNEAKEEAQVIIEEFSFLDDWEDRYQLLIDQGRKLADFPSHYRDDDHRLRGCQSVVYFSNFFNPNGTITFVANSDAAIVQGLIALMLKVFSEKKPQEIIDTNINFLEKIGLDEHLSPTRKNGLSSLIYSIKNVAKLKLSQ